MPQTRRSWIVRVGLVLVLGAMTGAPAWATVIVPANVEVLAAEAAVIVHAVVVDVRAQRVPGESRIDSIVTLEASTYWKGDLGATVTIRLPGGRLGRYRSVVVGAPVLAPGEEVVLFLAGDAPSLPHVIGMSQGLYRVVGDPVTGRRLVVPSPLLAPTGAPVPVVRGDATRRLASVDEFGQLLTAIASRAARPSGVGAER